ncbi:VOC family protein [Lentilitoribacter sp. EG35]|uniref:VOC family protein n=1 Tax=Lentilitoribacter sp. EG35 TaxID=3234192 RepID=UPI00345F25E0
MSNGQSNNGQPPKNWAALKPELLVEDFEISRDCWCNAFGFRIAYQRPDEKFAYLERPEGAQIMISQRHHNGKWKLGDMAHPLGQGVMFQINVSNFEELHQNILAHGLTLYDGARDEQDMKNPREIWRNLGDRDGGSKELFVLDPNGYLIMFSQEIGERPLQK